MVTKLSRNSPCSCGSGKKYKKCCLQKSEIVSLSKLQFNRLTENVENQTAQYLAPNEFKAAYAQFIFLDEEVEEVVEEDLPCFVPWVLSHWPGQGEQTFKYSKLLDRYIQDLKNQPISPQLEDIFKSSIRTPFSIYEIIKITKHQGVLLCDVFSKNEIWLSDKNLSLSASKNLLIFARVIPFQGQNFLWGNHPLPLPSWRKFECVDFGVSFENFPWSQSELMARQEDVRGLFFSLLEETLNPVVPQLKNTDGEDINFQTIYYQIESVTEAFQALAQLNPEDPQKLMQDNGAFDPSGALTKINFNWIKRGNKIHSQWDTTLLGEISLEGNKLNITVNSNERAQKIKELVNKYLPGKALFLRASIETQTSIREQIAQGARQEDHKNNSMIQLSELDPVDRAAIEEHLQKNLENHYRAWIDMALPALNGQTPREAVKDPCGKEKVRTLVEGICNNPNPTTPKVDLSFLQKELDL